MMKTPPNLLMTECLARMRYFSEEDRALLSFCVCVSLLAEPLKSIFHSIRTTITMTLRIQVILLKDRQWLIYFKKLSVQLHQMSP